MTGCPLPHRLLLMLFIWYSFLQQPLTKNISQKLMTVMDYHQEHVVWTKNCCRLQKENQQCWASVYMQACKAPGADGTAGQALSLNNYPPRSKSAPRSHPQLQHHHQICWRHKCYRPDHRRKWSSQQRGGQTWHLGARVTTSKSNDRWQNRTGWRESTANQWQPWPGLTTPAPSQRQWDNGSSSSAGWRGSSWNPGHSVTSTGPLRVSWLAASPP